MEGVRLLHTTYQQQLREMREVRADRSDRGDVRFSVGQVFIHKKVGPGVGAAGELCCLVREPRI